MRHGSLAIGFLTMGALVCSPALSQQPAAPAPVAQPPTVKTSVEEVLLDIIVRDKKGKPITDLKAEELTVIDNGAPQTITSFQREWVELGLNGDLLGRWKLDPSDRFPGVAFASDNQVYVHRFGGEAKSSRVFRLNREKSTWEAVNAPNAELYGADGDKLVFAKWSDGVMHLSWYQQP